jgi:hypothetical protein
VNLPGNDEFRELNTQDVLDINDALAAAFANGVAFFWNAQGQNPYSLLQAIEQMKVDTSTVPIETVFLAMMAVGWEACQRARKE